MSNSAKFYRVTRKSTIDGTAITGNVCTTRFADNPDGTEYWLATFSPPQYIIKGMVHESDAILRLAEQLLDDAIRLKQIARELQEG